MARKNTHDIQKVKPRMLEAAAMAAEGKTTKEIAAHFGVCEASVRDWLRNETVKAEYLNIVRANLVPMVAKATRLLNKQMDSKNANGFLSQNAATTILNRYGADVLEENSAEVVITFASGVPDIGMPEDDGEEDDE